MLRITPILAVLAVSAGARADETTYYVGHNVKYVNIGFESQADLETIIGSANQATGEIKFDPEKGTGSVSLKLPVISIKTGIDKRDEHLQSEMFLDAKKFPDITFVSKKVKKLDGRKIEVTGDFTMHGVAKEITVTVEWKELPDEAVKKAKFPDGKWVKFSSDFDVKFSDHGVKLPEMVGGKVSDTIKIKMYIFAGTGKIEKK